MPFLGEITLIRRRYVDAITINDAGEPVRGSYVDEPFRGAWQSAGGKQTQIDRSNERSSDYRRIICAPGILRVADPRTQYQADEVVCDGNIYKVVSIQPHGNLIPHDDVTVVRRREADG